MPLYYFNLKLFIWEVESEKRLETEKERERARERALSTLPTIVHFPNAHQQPRLGWSWSWESMWVAGP